jgi:DNA polymerase III subunit delta
MTKVAAGKVEGFLANPAPDCRGLLLYGPNAGLVHERAEGFVARMVEDPHDPFRVAELTPAALKDDPARLIDEVGALSLTGGTRIVRLRDAGDGQSGALDDALGAAEKTDSIILVESGDLGPRSSLRRLFEGAKNGAALACYGDEGRELDELIAASLTENGLSLDNEARAVLLDRLSSDRSQIRGEIGKLALYAQEPGADGQKSLSYDDIIACIGDSAELSLEAVSFAVAGGDAAAIERALARAFREGIAPVSLLRAVGRHLQRLQLAAAKIEAGASDKTAMDDLRPKVFFKQAPAFRRQLGLWTTQRLGHALGLALDAEIDCKRAGAPAQTVCGRTLFRIAAGSRSARARS